MSTIIHAQPVGARRRRAVDGVVFEERDDLRAVRRIYIDLRNLGLAALTAREIIVHLFWVASKGPRYVSSWDIHQLRAEVSA